MEVTTRVSMAQQPLSLSSIRLPVAGMKCASCAGRVERALTEVAGVTGVSVNLMTAEAVVMGICSVEALTAAVEATGFTVPAVTQVESHDLADQERRREYHVIRWRLLVGVLLLLPEWWLFHAGHDQLLGQFLLVTPIQWWVGWPFHQAAWRALRHRLTDMNTLISLGSCTAYLYSVAAMLWPTLFQTGAVSSPPVYFETSATIIVLVLLGRFLELRARGKTSQAIERLLDLTPPVACVVRQGTEQTVPLADVVVGDHLRIRPGERIAVDGVVEQGQATLDESMLTGEALPVVRGPGDELAAGTINRDGSLLMRATRVGQETVLARIVAMVRNAQAAKPPIARLADRVAARFVPAVLAVAVATFLVWYLFGPEPRLNWALLNFIAVVVIACPCALGLATPVSVMVGIGRGAEQGILIRAGDALEQAHRLDRVLFDKTGTLTQGRPVLTDWSGSLSDLERVAALEAHSEHPLARAIVAGARERCGRVGQLAVSDFQAVVGQGVVGLVDGHKVVVGTAAMLRDQGIDPAPMQQQELLLAQQGKSVMLVAIDDCPVGTIAVTDTIKPESVEAIALLKEMGIASGMLTGDTQAGAWEIARQLGIEKDDVVAGCLPQQKAEVIRQLQRAGHVVAMVGDGINDAPAMAQADVAMALGTGTDIAIESADITLMSGDPRAVVTTIQLSRATMRNIRQNLFWAFAYNVLLIPLAAGVWFPWTGILLAPELAAAAMGLSSVTVVSNALRLRKISRFH
ncbi:MAG: copper-translocating P-type ATPase [Magnetococcales bacterium]|nr:copper-translocating P-type ATPase [Magnetococcales bacterium]